jgi:predicted nucleic acid-binding protein
MDTWYVDPSALAKLIQHEPETAALTRWLATRRWVISDLHRTELRRAARRAGPSAATRAELLLVELDTIALTGDRFDDAGRLEPSRLRSLDALHLVAAQALGRDLAGIVAYDGRLLDAAGNLGMATASPS